MVDQVVWLLAPICVAVLIFLCSEAVTLVFAAACHFCGRQYLQAASDLLACFAYVCQQDSNHLHLEYRM